jgi:hypothetical protein
MVLDEKATREKGTNLIWLIISTFAIESQIMMEVFMGGGGWGHVTSCVKMNYCNGLIENT